MTEKCPSQPTINTYAKSAEACLKALENVIAEGYIEAEGSQVRKKGISQQKWSLGQRNG